VDIDACFLLEYDHPFLIGKPPVIKRFRGGQFAAESGGQVERILQHRFKHAKFKFRFAQFCMIIPELMVDTTEELSSIYKYNLPGYFI
jgi:hypothetical protein